MSPDKILSSLQHELEFLNRGGYRNPNGWRPLLYFEDSEICPRNKHSGCRDSGCVLITFVPEDYRSHPAACRRIPMGETGETLEDLYKTATIEETEIAVRKWLSLAIGKLESPLSESVKA